MQIVNLSKLLKNFSSGWVAITSDYKKVVTSGKTLKEVTEKVKKQNRDDIVLIPAAKNYRGFITSTS
ncbi:hypothetical protein A3B42_02105 [Candidatus Daviesbacteria bacterium RIFCSPLOWO2_01_FULL_38_10]|uniref:DUF5678 domain-containing protein n=1 Tax=Candidatus Daviesbacteria bacterium GW2011_GWF2_38_6 TaxID=1618432 RepID=A0A0G0KK14_9BACT|nr:MAG: hypothetical protein US80_C0006G0024 [Candidatus Daviesbacteria bacterium GW2011_GWA2_38_17]KKQ79092.1 MAG: hypothetical protein US99_C0003G0013 [Candidatus Daviesbacteria bacterium GW2011_GWF2_38_6]OGE25876.1 MAG: hypothetical protein A3D02_01425 [Candidatus Daviesbacteria bacterium RIFCSPHIGHO2_02_FULL_39_41]OGE29717.1 MAG: hypothetical protein A2772_03035 [Candidatus Daviesbacteria bacterium RIFCSPHIGHO2_01_FULL_38_8b]OGE39129.1 MAG: hypothetical protein A3B42_02105 [Candidatus Davie